MLQTYRTHVAERAALGIPALPLSAKQTSELIELLKNPPQGEASFLLDLITHRVPAGVDDAAKVKASYLAAVAHGTEVCSLISRAKATELLGTMLGGYNLTPLIDLLTILKWLLWQQRASRKLCSCSISFMTCRKNHKKAMRLPKQ